MSKESDSLINRGDEEPARPFKKILQPCMAEFLGVCLFVFVGCMTVQDTLGVNTKGNPTTSASAVAVGHGFTIALLVVAFGNISGAHLNPAVTFGIFLSGAISPVMALGYVISQLAGAMVGAGFVRAVLPLAEYKMIGGGAHILSAVGPGPGIVCEILLTTVLVLTVLLSAVDDHNKSNLAPLAIGFAVTVCILAGINTTGASMNPARSFGPAVALSVYDSGVWTYHYVYWVGPLLGSVIAAIFYRIIFACPEKRFFCKE